MKQGDKIPDLALPASGGKTLKLRDFKGRKLVVYFYPKDNTPGCTQEGQDFRDLYKDYQKAGIDVLGVSKDSVKSHDGFAAKFGFPFALLSDGEGAACDAFGVMKEKSMYGKKYIGVERSTFLFGADGKLAQEWRGVKVNGHAAAVLEAAKGI